MQLLVLFFYFILNLSQADMVALLFVSSMHDVVWEREKVIGKK